MFLGICPFPLNYLICLHTVDYIAEFFISVSLVVVPLFNRYPLKVIIITPHRANTLNLYSKTLCFKVKCSLNFKQMELYRIYSCLASLAQFYICRIHPCTCSLFIPLMNTILSSDCTTVYLGTFDYFHFLEYYKHHCC